MAKIKVKSIVKGDAPCQGPAPTPDPKPDVLPTDPPRRFPPPPPFFFPSPCCPGNTQVVDNIKVISLTPDVIQVQEGTYQGMKAFGISTTAEAAVQPDWEQDDPEAKDFIKNKPELADVATSGSYNDLVDKPEIPSGQIQSDWAQDDEQEVDFIKNKPELAPVATSGSYDDLEDKPHIPVDPVQSDWNQLDENELDYIKNKPSTFGAASAQQDGTDGFVPAPDAGDQDKYLKGDGTWATINIPEVADMVGATEQANGAHGLVPEPKIANKDQFLRGDGQWADVDIPQACSEDDMDSWLDEVDGEVNNNG